MKPFAAKMLAAKEAKRRAAGASSTSAGRALHCPKCRTLLAVTHGASRVTVKCPKCKRTYRES